MTVARRENTRGYIIIPAKHFALTAAIFEGGLAVVAIALGWLLGQPPLKTLHLDLYPAALGVAATLPPLALFWFCLKCPLRPFQTIRLILDEAIVPLFRDCRFRELAVIAALAGIGEEMLFRGVIQAAVAQQIGGPRGIWLGLLVAAVLFAASLHHSHICRVGRIDRPLLGLALADLWKPPHPDRHPRRVRFPGIAVSDEGEESAVANRGRLGNGGRQYTTLTSVPVNPAGPFRETLINNSFLAVDLLTMAEASGQAGLPDVAEPIARHGTDEGLSKRATPGIGGR
jgi:hypothetical protein